jgi:putative transcriptional regulator
MRTIVKHHEKRNVKRNVFGEMKEGMTALAESRERKRTLRTHAVEFKPAPTVTPKD